MSESAPEVTFDAPARPKKPAKKKAKARSAAPKDSRPSAPFPGLSRPTGTNHGCATACNAQACSISGKPYCAHPIKGGLQPGDMSNDAALKRLKAARDQLDVRLDPDRFKT